METSTDVGALFAALSRAQGAMRGAVKDSLNPFFKSKYADLAAVWEACRAPLAENELCVVQGASAAGASVTVTTLLGHSSGQWVRDTLILGAKDDTPQSIGSATSYARRYGLSAIVGQAPEDDDGESAQPRPNQMAPLRERPNRPAPAKSDVKGRSDEPPLPSDSDAPPAVNRAGKRVDSRPLTEPLRDDEIAF